MIKEDDKYNKSANFWPNGKQHNCPQFMKVVMLFSLSTDCCDL